MRENFAAALKSAMKNQDKRAVSTLRLIQAAIHDRDIANRSAGKDPVSDDEIRQILSKMVRQREESARLYEEGNRLELAQQEQEEIAIIRAFLPRQIEGDEVKAACRGVIAEVGADGLRDMGRCMSVLKDRYAGRMDFGEASGIVKTLLK